MNILGNNPPLFPPLLIRTNRKICEINECNCNVSYSNHTKCIRHARKGSLEWEYHRDKLKKINKNRIILNLGYSIFKNYEL